jgi:hypothetical protein
MEIEQPIFETLVASGVLDKRHAQNILEDQKKVMLRREAATGIENGVIVGSYFSHITKLMVANKQDVSGIDLDTLKSLKNSITPAAKLYNWNIILKELEKVNIIIDKDTQALITSGDVDMVKDLIKRLVEVEGIIQKELKAKEPTKKLEDIKEGIDILTMSSSKDPMDTDSSLELLLNIMCKSFKMKPKQSAALLTNSNQYLLHSVVKGLKGNYDPILKFYRNMAKFVHHMCNLLELESQKNQNHSTMLMIMNALKTGLFSYHDEVIMSTLDLLSRISEVAFEMSIFPAVYQWFITTTQEGGISALLYILKKHEDLIKPVVFTLVTFSKGNLPNILKEVIKPLYPSPREYIAIINDFTHVLAENEKTREELLDSGLIDFWLEENIAQADNEAKASPEERTTSIAYVVDLWVLFPDKMDNREDIKGQIINVLKKLC